MSRGEAEKTVPGVDATPEKEQSTGQKLFEQVSTLALAVLIAVGIRTFVIEPFRIPSGSMLPTLLIGDHLFVNKFVFGARLPFTDVRLPALREPQRGDVVVFQVARGRSANGTGGIIPADRRPDLPRDDFVKRIVGLPGDRLEVRDGRVYINHELIQMVDLKRNFSDEHGRSLGVQNELLGDCLHEVLDDPRQKGPTQTPRVIEEGRYFLMGDNRDYSNDSRTWGTVRFNELKGPAFVLYWSWDVNGSFLEFLNPINWWSAEKRWGRVFQRVRCRTTTS